MKRKANPAAKAKQPKAVRIAPHTLARLSNAELASAGLARMGSDGVVIARRFEPPKLYPGVVPVDARRRFKPLPGEAAFMALDSALVAPMYAWANQFCGQVGFPGYPYLAELALRNEYRSAAETTAKEMTRRWLKLKSASAGDKKVKIEALDKRMRELKVRALFRQSIENDYYFGTAFIYMDIKGQDSDAGRQLPLLIEEGSGALGKGCIKGLYGVEPMWMTPYSYNSTNPTAPDFFKPTSWFSLGKKTHATRLLQFISRPVPDLFKPAYNFGGISMSQLMEAYVAQWYRTRDSVSDAVFNFSTSGVMTNLATLLEEDDTGSSVGTRAEFFNKTKGNKGLMLLDKDTEEFFQFNMPLGSLDKLQAQSQEHMCNPSHIPAVKFLGVEPTGLNASSEGTIKVWYDFLHAEQETVYDPQMDVLLPLLQLDCFGSIDPDITYEWVPLDEPSGKETAEIRKSDADAGAAYIDRGVISPDEERERLQSDPTSGYNNLNGKAPGPQEDPGMEDGMPIAQVAENDKDRQHQSEQSDVDREHSATQADADRKAAAKTKAAKS